MTVQPMWRLGKIQLQEKDEDIKWESKNDKMGVTVLHTSLDDITSKFKRKGEAQKLTLIETG